MGTTAIAKTCVANYEGCVGYFSKDDFLVVYRIIDAGGTRDAVGGVTIGLILAGRAIDLYELKYEISNVRISRDVAVGNLPDGREVWTWAKALRCK